MLLGDFNIPQYILHNINDPLYNVFREYCDFLELNQYNHISNVNNRLLDLVFGNYNCNVKRCESPLVKEDAIHHPSIEVSFEFRVAKIDRFPKSLDNKTYNFKKANYPELYSALLREDWSFLLDHTEVNVACEAFYGALYSIFDRYVPYYKTRESNPKYPCWYSHDIVQSIKEKYRWFKKCWYSHDIVQSIKEKYRWFKKYKRTGSASDYEKYKSLRTSTKHLIDATYSRYIEHIELEIQQDSKSFWSYVQSRKRCDRHIADILSILSWKFSKILSPFGHTCNHESDVIEFQVVCLSTM
ncbi:hypothetical protein QE152_g23133 [Popillia japonica]|uniref:Uncharacterized protein n=1 Tax=Popillia japonica TaxID=7064 RepID=A0AAW1KI36_POPJA